MQTILFRADSSSIIGTGHIMRDLVLAEQFKDANIIFATQNLSGNISHKIEEKSYKIEVLNSNDIEEVIVLIKKYNIDMIVLDHYDINYDYERELKETTGVEIFVLDDTYKKHHCDILLNHNVCGNAEKYRGLVPQNCELKCGADYTLLRNEFIEEKQKPKNPSLKNKYHNVFIAMGGTDHSNINIEILKVLASFPHIHAHVVTTSANAHLQELNQYVENQPNITLYINTDQMAALMHQADLAIVSASVTVNEILFMETPFIAIQTAENQKEIYEFLFKNNFCVLEKFAHEILKKYISFHLGTKKKPI